jgi:hypothetical protein
MYEMHPALSLKARGVTPEQSFHRGFADRRGRASSPPRILVRCLTMVRRIALFE